MISSQRFLKKQGLGNEVPFFICAYPADEAVEIETDARKPRHAVAEQRIRVLEVDLYDLSVSLLRKRGIWDDVLATEPK